MNIGQKIKELRMQNNLTLEELANRCELTKGFLSQLERNLTSPSIATLDDILEALGTNLSSFFNEKDQRIIFKEEDYYVSEKDGASITWIVPNAQKNDMEPLILTLQKGSTSQVIEPHIGEELCYVLSGEVILIDNEREYVLKCGETFYMKGRHRHSIRNDKEEEARLLWVMTPPNF